MMFFASRKVVFDGSVDMAETQIIDSVWREEAPIPVIRLHERDESKLEKREA